MSTDQGSDLAVENLSPPEANPKSIRIAAVTMALVIFKITLGIVIIIRSGRADLDLVPPIVQTAAYVVVLLAVILQRRVGLALSAVFVGYAMVVSIQEFGFDEIERVPLYLSTLLLAIALLVNTAMPVGRTTVNAGAWLSFIAMGLTGALLGLFIPLDVVSAEANSSRQVGPSAFIPDQAKEEILAGLGLTADGARRDCIVDRIFDEFGMQSMTALQTNGVSASEQERIAELSEDC